MNDLVTPSGLSVRAATAMDRAAAARMLAAGLAEAGLPVDGDGVARTVELALSHGASAWLVIALSHGLPAGVLLANPVVSAEHGGAALRLESLYVPPERRGRGIERALVEFVANEARQSGMAAIEAEAVGDEELGALGTLGFTPIERRRARRRL